MKNLLLLFIAVLVQNNLSAQDYFHKFYNFQEVSKHLPWSFLVEEDDLVLKLGMDFCHEASPCAPLVRVGKSKGKLLDVSYLDISSPYSENALMRIGDEYFVLGKELPFTNRPSIFIMDDSLNIKDRIRLDLEVDQYLFVEWEGMVERSGFIYALANVRTNFGDDFGLISKFDAVTFQHEKNIIVGKTAVNDATAEDLQMDAVGNIYVFTIEDWDDGAWTSHRTIITQIDVNDEVSVLDSHIASTDLSLHQFLVIDKNNFVYSKDEREEEFQHLRNWNDILRGLNYEGDNLDTWLFQFYFEEPNADFSNMEVRKYDLYDIAAARNGDILVCGTIEDTPDSPELGGPYGQEDWGEDLPIYKAGFITRLTKYGELLWQRIYIFPNITNPDLREAGFEFSGDLLQIEEDANGDIYAVGRKTTHRVSGSSIPPMDSLWVVKTDKNGCLDIADCNEEELVITSVGKNIVKNSFALKISPNPVSDVLSLASPFLLKSYSLHNSLGQMIQTGDIEGETIDVSQINVGIFFLTIYTKDNKIRTEKIIKN